MARRAVNGTIRAHENLLAFDAARIGSDEGSS
jgi:hypothetical protein